jgi:hypothetical protein
MTVKCDGCGAETDVPEAAILSEAGRIFATRRKRCGPKPKPVACPWCGRACAGRAGLMQHLPACPEAIAYYAGLDLTEVTEFFNEAGVPPPDAA